MNAFADAQVRGDADGMEAADQRLDQTFDQLISVLADRSDFDRGDELAYDLLRRLDWAEERVRQLQNHIELIEARNA